MFFFMSSLFLPNYFVLDHIIITDFWGILLIVSCVFKRGSFKTHLEAVSMNLFLFVVFKLCGFVGLGEF